MLKVWSIGRKSAGKVVQVPLRAPRTEEHAVTVFRYYSEGWRVRSCVGWRCYHRGVWGKLWDAQTPASRPRDGTQGLRCVFHGTPLVITEIARDFNLNTIWVIG